MGKAAASARVTEEWLRRVEAEYRSTAIAAHLALWLVQIGASPDLVKAALRIAREELGHATLSHRVHRAAFARFARGTKGAAAAGPSLDRTTLELVRQGGPLEDDVARVCVEVFCLGETAAVRLFRELRRGCDVPVARRTLDRVLRDEVGHRDFGWTLLSWLLELPGQGPRLRTLVSTELPACFQRLRALYAPAEVEGEAALPREDARWGLMPPARYGELLRETFEKDYVRRFARLGIDAHAAWRRAVPRVG
jgi:hypothetical protein